MERAFVDPATGDTTCVWSAPSLAEMTTLFATAKVEVASITEVEEVLA
jgi:hypothetical protein